VANIKSQIKRNRQNDKRRLRNRVIRGGTRVAVKNARAAIDEGVPESKAALASAISALDRAVEKGVLHRNNAARRKSRLVRAFNAMKPGGAKVEPAAVKPVVEPESPAKGKKTKGSKTASKVEPKVEAVKETKKAAAKKPAAKAPAKKTAAKKTVKKPTKTKK
jgi:small subunit ribosomal protein S20